MDNDFTALIRALLERSDLTAPLREEKRWPRFFDQLSETGRELGFSFSSLDVEQAAACWNVRELHPVAPPQLHPDHFRGWLPDTILSGPGSAPAVVWRYAGNAPLKEPFYRDDLQKIARHPFNLFFSRKTPLEFLERFADPSSERVEPTGIIFHLSRCGSTLAANMLAGLEGSIVLSEPTPVDQLFRYFLHHPLISEEERIRLLRGTVGAMAGKRRGDERRLFVKTDGWHTSMIPLFEKAFPQTPWVFLYRTPEEVLASHRLSPGVQVVPGLIEPEWFGEGEAFLHTVSFAEYGGFALGKIMEWALEPLEQGRGLALDYTGLPDGIQEKVLPHFRLAPTTEERERMTRATLRHAKEPEKRFDGTEREKEKLAAGKEIRKIAERWMTPLYLRLLRVSAAPPPGKH